MNAVEREQVNELADAKVRQGRNNRAKGAKAERDFVNYVKARWGWRAHRNLSRPYEGKQGPDDILGIPYLTCEVRHRRGFNPKGWLEEAALNPRIGTRPCVIIRPDGVVDPAKWGMLMTVEEGLKLIRELEVEKMR